MEDIRSLIQRAKRRLGLNDFAQRLHIIAMAVAAIAFILVIAGKATPVVREFIAWSWAAPVLAVITLIAAGIWWFQHRPSPLQVAIDVDDRLSLREKLSTALLCRGREDAFAQAAIDDAIRVARNDETRKRLSGAFSVKPPRRWWISPMILVIASIAGFTLPNGDLFAKAPEDALTEAEQREIEELQAEVKQAVQEVAQELKVDPKELEQMLEEIDPDADGAGERPTPEQARREAFKKLNALADKIREEADTAKADSLEALKNKLGEMTPPEEGPAADLAKSLAKGDFSEAKDALEKLQAKLNDGAMNEEQKAQLANQLQHMGEQLEKLAAQNDALKDMLEKNGLDSKLAQNPEALKQALEQAKENMTPEQAQQLQQMAAAMQQANSMCQNMSGACQSMAGQIGQMGQMGEGAGAMSGQLSELEMMAADMAMMNAQLAKLGSQCQGLGEGMGMCQGAGMGQGQGQGQGISQAAAQMNWMQMMGQGSGPGMGNRGQGAGGRGTRFATNVQFTPEKATVKNQGGPIIGRRFVEGQQLIRGESFAEFKGIVETANSRAQEELNEHMIPTKYKPGLQHYFGELQEMTKSVEAAEQPPGGE